MFVLLLGSGLGLVFLSSVIMLSYIVIFNPCRLLNPRWLDPGFKPCSVHIWHRLPDTNMYADP